MKTGKTLTLDEFMQSRLGRQIDVYLVVSIKLTGVLVAYDQEVLFLRAGGAGGRPLQMIMWSAITTVSTPGESNPE